MGACFYTAFLGTLQIVGFIVQDRFRYSATKAVSIASYSFLIIAVATILAQALIVRLKWDRSRAHALTGSLIGAAGYGVAVLAQGVGGAVRASVVTSSAPLA